MNKNKWSTSFLAMMLKFSVSTWVSALFSFALTPIITRYFNPTEMGKINLFVTVGMLIEYLTLLGMNQGYIRFYNEASTDEGKNKLFQMTTGIALAATSVAVFAVFVFHDEVSNYIIGENGWFIASALACYLLSHVFLTMSNGLYRMEQNAKMFNIQSITINTGVKLSYALAIFGAGTANQAILFLSLSCTLIGCTFLFIQRRHLRIVRTDEQSFNLKGVIYYSIPMIPAMFMTYLNTSLPNLFLKRYVDYAAIGIYSAAITLVSIVSLVQTGFNVFWTPYVYQNYQHKKENICDIQKLIAFAMPCIGIVIILMLEPIYLILGDTYRSSKEYFGLLLASPIMYTIAETTGVGINISKKTNINVLITLATIVVNYALCSTFVPAFGGAGAACAVCSAAAVMLILKTLFAGKYYRVIDTYIKTFFALAVYVIVAVVNLLVQNTHVVFFTGSIGLIIIGVVYKQDLKKYIAYASTIIKRSGE